MERLILKKLLDWKHSPYRKPLILKGVRQVGKTWVLKEFASSQDKLRELVGQLTGDEFAIKGLTELIK